MGKIIAFANQKGGVGKTTSCVNVAASLGVLGKKVLIVDLDPQGNATSGVGVSKKGLKTSTRELLNGELTAREVIRETPYKNLSVIPTGTALAGAEFELLDFEEPDFRMKEALSSVRDDYDYILIDCPPSLNMITVNALVAADTVLVPIQCEYFALEGLEQLLHTVNLVKKRLNPELEIEGIVFTMFDARTNLSLQVVEEVKRSLGQNVYRTIIPRNVRLGESPSHGLPIHLYDPKSKGAEAYQLLAEEVMEKEWN